MGSTADAAGVGPVIRHGDKEYRVSPVTAVVVGKFEVFLEDCGWDAVERYGRTHTESQKKEQADAHRRDCATDVYAQGTPEFKRMALTARGIRKILLICLQEASPGDPVITAGLVETFLTECPDEVTKALLAINWIEVESADGNATG